MKPEDLIANFILTCRELSEALSDDEDAVKVLAEKGPILEAMRPLVDALLLEERLAIRRVAMERRA